MLDSLEACDFDKKAGRIGGYIFKDLKKAGNMGWKWKLSEVTGYVEISRRLYEGQSEDEIFERAKKQWKGWL